MTRVLAALLALLVPVLVTTGGSPEVATTALVAVAVAALAILVVQAGTPVGRVVAQVAVGDDAVPLVLSGRVVDPVAHPRRPRAPGRG